MYYGPNKNEKFPNKNIPSVCFIKNVITRPNIEVGDYTYYDDIKGADKFEEHVTHHYEFLGDKLIIGKFCQIASGIKIIMKNLIYIEQDQINKFDSLQELYEFIFGTKYFTLTEKEKFIRRYEIAFYKIKFYNLGLDIVHTKMGTLGEQYKIIDKKYKLEKALIIDDEKQFVMSLCRIPTIMILESKFSNNLLTTKEKEKYKGNYIVINEII